GGCDGQQGYAATRRSPCGEGIVDRRGATRRPGSLIIARSRATWSTADRPRRPRGRQGPLDRGQRSPPEMARGTRTEDDLSDVEEDRICKESMKLRKPAAADVTYKGRELSLHRWSESDNRQTMLRFEQN